MKPCRATITAYLCAGLFLLSVSACAASRGARDPVPVVPLWWGSKLRLAVATDCTSWGVHYVRGVDRATLTDDWGRGGVHYRALGFEFEWQDWGEMGVSGWKRGARSRVIGVPSALVLPLLALFPVRHFRRCAVVRRRARSGLCLECGYDLRSTPQRCPECGATT